MMVKRSHGFAISLVLGLLLTVEGAAMAQTYYVKPGDSLYTIATRFGTSASQLQSANGLQSNYIYPGQALNIPGGSGTTSSSSSSRYTVAPGDTVYLIAKKYGISMDALRQANRLTGDQILPGQVLTIPAAGSSGSGSGSQYSVRANDSLYLIAQRYGITVDALKKANGLTSNSIWVGQVLQIPSGSTSGQSTSGSLTLSASDTELLARLVSAESSGEPFEGQVAVAATVLNRLRDPRYPKTISGIIYQVVNGVYYQYSPVLDGRINAPAVPSAYQAVSQALKGWDPSYGATGFFNPDKTSNTWVSSHPITVTIGEHVFFKN